uniref:Uncharacterized protein n=1 Tax=Wuchereria bancrofti TaxID=6293 RepID=A0AAF5PGU1_WUCBA
MDVLPFFDTLIIIIGTQNAFTIQLKKKRLSFSKYEQLMIGASITENVWENVWESTLRTAERFI